MVEADNGHFCKGWRDDLSEMTQGFNTHSDMLGEIISSANEESDDKDLGRTTGNLMEIRDGWDWVKRFNRF
jgi:hypothetical protein